MTADSDSAEAPSVSIGLLRSQAVSRLAAVQAGLQAKGISAVFLRSVKPDPMGDMGFLGGLLLHGILGGAFEGFMGGSPFSLCNEFQVAGTIEGVLSLRDGAAQERPEEEKKQISFFYPKGRNKKPIKETGPMKSRFNKASNQNGHFSYDVQGGMAAMFEIIDMLDWLEKQGVEAVCLDKERSVYRAVKAATHEQRALSKKAVQQLRAAA